MIKRCQHQSIKSKDERWRLMGVIITQHISLLISDGFGNPKREDMDCPKHGWADAEESTQLEYGEGWERTRSGRVETDLLGQNPSSQLSQGNLEATITPIMQHLQGDDGTGSDGGSRRSRG